MKKIYIFVFSLMAFFLVGVSDVKAYQYFPINYEKDFYQESPSTYISYEPDFIRSEVDVLLNNTIKELVDLYDSTYSDDYPYFVIGFRLNFNDEDISSATSRELQVYLNLFENEPVLEGIYDRDVNFYYLRLPIADNAVYRVYRYDSESGSYNLVNPGYGPTYTTVVQLYRSSVDEDVGGGIDRSNFNTSAFYYANFEPIFPEIRTSGFLKDYDAIRIPSYELDSLVSMPFEPPEKVPRDTLQNSIVGDDGGSIDLYNYKRVNLNDYAYIALSLKDYSVEEAFRTYVYVKGQVCVTSVYNYSMTKKPVSTDLCYATYDDFTMQSLYVLSSDIENHAVYYVEGHDKSIDNYIEYDSSIFDISYVSEEDRDNPIINVGGQDYTGVGLDDIEDNAGNLTDEGFIPGEVEGFDPIGSLGDLFSQPLEMFQNLISGVSSFFSLMVTLIGMLPPVLQSFLYFAFMLAVIVGILKILL